MSMIRKINVFLVILCLCMALAACGKETLCAHGAGEDCGICALEQGIEALPTPEEWLEMDLEQQNAVYDQAQAAAEQFNALEEEQQGQVSNLDKLIALHETFNQQIAPLE